MFLIFRFIESIISVLSITRTTPLSKKILILSFKTLILIIFASFFTIFFKSNDQKIFPFFKLYALIVFSVLIIKELLKVGAVVYGYDPIAVNNMKENTINKFLYEGGIKSFVKYINKNKISIHEEPIVINLESYELLISNLVSLCFSIFFIVPISVTIPVNI